MKALFFNSLIQYFARQKRMTIVLYVSLATSLSLLVWLLTPPSVTLTDWPTPQSQEHSWNTVFENPVDLKLEVLHVGDLEIDRNILLQSPPDSWDDRYSPLIVKSYLIDHPVHGAFAFDAGFHDSFAESNSGNYNWLMQIMIKLSAIKNGLSTPSLHQQLLSSELNLEGVFLTHLHPDHTSGLASINHETPVFIGKKEFDWLGRLSNSQLIKTHKNWQALSFHNSTSIEPFDRVIDVFGDGSVWAISTPGHTSDHISYLINDLNGPILIAGDASHFEFGFNQALAPAAIGEANKTLAIQSLESIIAFTQHFPQVQVELGHE